MSAHRAKKLVEAGVWLRISGDHEGARRLFEQALVLDPTNVRAKQLLEAPPSTPLAQQATDHTTADEAATARNPFLRGDSPSRSVGLDVDWGLAAILPESQSVFRAPQKVDEPGDAPGAWGRGATPPRGATGAQVQPGSAPAMEMVSNAPRSQPAFPTSDPSHPIEVRDTEVQTLLQGAQDLIGLDDHSGAMDLILRAQRLAPDRIDVRRLRERTEAKLLGMLESKLGRMEAMPRVLLKQDEIIWLNLDHRAGFVLAQIDGTLSLEDLFAVSGMSRLDTARILVHLKEQGVISLA
ncbi:MAG TPA: hypothetical protein VN918_11350 [Myxococcaceae bacterium]|nr:hypothetical protein [Myxococcaceae bacterium]